MDIDMDIDYGAGVDAPVQQIVQDVEADHNESAMPAAYYENLDARPVEQWPDYLNLQGVSDFDPNDPLYYAMEHCLEPRVKQLRWVNDNSVNLQYYSPQDAGLALQALSDPSAGDAASIAPETGRPARPYSKKPESVLILRQANAGDQKAKGASTRSNFYRHNPDVRGGDRGREREPRRRPPPQRDYLDYDDPPISRERRRRSANGDEPMRDEYDSDRRGARRNGNRGDRRDRGGRLSHDGRLAQDTDSYRPGSRNSREPRLGRLRGRSASPGSGDEGDGRYGFTEEGTSVRSRYRSRSRSRPVRRRRQPSSERWTHDRANFAEYGGASDGGGRWAKETSPRYSADLSSMGNHRRSDAFDETGRKGSLLSRMTKDGQPVAPQGRSLASRITRDDDDSESTYGRLRDDYSAVRDTDFSERKRGLASRMTRDEDTEGINIRGVASGA